MPDTQLYDILGVQPDVSGDQLKSVCFVLKFYSNHQHIILIEHFILWLGISLWEMMMNLFCVGLQKISQKVSSR